jgi:hypothetical protein
MAQTTYTRVLPNLTQATRRAVYEKLQILLSHLPVYGIDLVSITVDVPTRTLAVTLTDPIPSAAERKHTGVEDE